MLSALQVAHFKYLDEKYHVREKGNYVARFILTINDVLSFDILIYESGIMILTYLDIRYDHLLAT